MTLNRFLASFLIFGFLLTPDASALAHDRSKKTGAVMPGINVSVYNYAQVPMQTLDETEREVARVLYKVGIETTWRDCSPALEDIYKDSNCTQLASPTDLMLRILPEIPVTPDVANERTMGFASANYATVSFRLAREEAAASGAMPSKVLWVAAAHEIGHALLGPDSHSPSGIMRARFSLEDFARGAPDDFTFTPEQGEQIRAEVGRRVQEQGATEVVTATPAK